MPLVPLSGIAPYSFSLVVADDLCASDNKEIKNVYENDLCNGILIKPAQAGTITNCQTSYNYAKEYKLNTILSSRSGENEDTTIMQLAIGWQVPQIKIGGFRGSEFMAKYNEALRISEATVATLPPANCFTWGN